MASRCTFGIIRFCSRACSSNGYTLEEMIPSSSSSTESSSSSSGDVHIKCLYECCKRVIKEITKESK
uniref:Uncharacterized protein n=1 Tax=Trichuris muris TaxID=70415 RepID=A0A5S6Q338_TRIMR